MKLKIFNGSLKPSDQSNTQALIQLVTETMNKFDATVDVVNLKELNYDFTTDSVKDDLTPHLIDVVKNCDMVSICLLYTSPSPRDS